MGLLVTDNYYEFLIDATMATQENLQEWTDSNFQIDWCFSEQNHYTKYNTSFYTRDCRWTFLGLNKRTNLDFLISGYNVLFLKWKMDKIGLSTDIQTPILSCTCNQMKIITLLL